MRDIEVYEAFADNSVTTAEIAAVTDEVIYRQVAELIYEYGYSNHGMTTAEITAAIRRYVGRE